MPYNDHIHGLLNIQQCILSRPCHIENKTYHYDQLKHISEDFNIYIYK